MHSSPLLVAWLAQVCRWGLVPSGLKVVPVAEAKAGWVPQELDWFPEADRLQPVRRAVAEPWVRVEAWQVYESCLIAPVPRPMHHYMRHSGSVPTHGYT